MSVPCARTTFTDGGNLRRRAVARARAACDGGHERWPARLLLLATPASTVVENNLAVLRLLSLWDTRPASAERLGRAASSLQAARLDRDIKSACDAQMDGSDERIMFDALTCLI